MPSCKKEVVNIKASIDDGFKSIRGWIKIIVYNIGTWNSGMFPSGCGFLLTTIKSRHNNQGNKDLH